MLNQQNSGASLDKDKPSGSHFDGKRYHALRPIKTMEAKNTWSMIKAYMFAKEQPAMPPKPMPVIEMTKAQARVFRIGHSTLFICLDGDFWLTDPVFCERASPFSFMGPKRCHQPPL